jgi:hypothetical protein
MTKLLFVYLIALCVTASNSVSAQRAPQADSQELPKGSNVNPDAGLIASFNEKVAAYNELRQKLAKESPRLKETTDPAQIGEAEKTLAGKIRTARATKKRGDIFTPATEAMFRRLIRPSMTKGSGAVDNKAIIKEDAPKTAEVPFKVNGEYPKEAPLSTVPPDVLKALPPLPDNLQYRIVGKHLILLCTQGNLIVDYMLNAIP